MMMDGENYLERKETEAGYNMGEYDYVEQMYYVLTGIFSGGEFRIFQSDGRFYSEYEAFAQQIAPYININEKSKFALVIGGQDKIEVKEIGAQLAWLENFEDFSHARGMALGNEKCGCADGITEITDSEGNVYKVIQIGNLCWMKENLKATRYSNGDSLLNFSGTEMINSIDSGAFYAYNNDAEKIQSYGYMYNLVAVSDPRNVCPVGWHVPNDSDWTELIDQFGGTDAGEALKEAGTAHWKADNYASNKSGFSALPGGQYRPGSFENTVGTNGFYWTYTLDSLSGMKNSGYQQLVNFNGYISKNEENWTTCFNSVRCVRDRK
jgi:uncharacterized protein (TIGR02145 family)